VVAAIGIVVVCAFAALYFLGSKGSINPVTAIGNIQLQNAVDRALKKDYRNSGIEFSVHYKSDFSKATVVLQIERISEGTSRLDVFRALLDIAREMKDESFETLELAHRGSTKFLLDGSYFRQLGRERDDQNPNYTIRTFPENLRLPSGRHAYESWSGGIFAVVEKEMEDFKDFHDKWYWDDGRY
jgi:hypothetical protein